VEDALTTRTIDDLVPDFDALPLDLQALVRYVRFMDAAFRVPVIDVRVGADAIVGVVPVVGDVLGGVLSLYIFIVAVKYGVPPGILLRMAFKTVLDLGLGSLPVVGDLFDVLYRDKLANVHLLLEHRTR
jgi:Domain of unknown function (DUF4112)